VASPSALISFRYPQQPTKNNKEMPGRMMLELHSPEDEMDYKSIYGYIRHYYKRVPDDEASLIAKSLVAYGRKHDLDPKFAAAVMARESAFNRHAISSSGARGLGQIKSLNYPALNIDDPHNIEQNTQGTVKYLKTMLTLWKGKSDSVALALASYYKGQGAVKRTQGQLDARTIGYVTDIMKNYDKLKLIKEDQKL
jgi:soluble lytic murein transglycosylase-like protein